MKWFCDSMYAICLAKNPIHHKRSKHTLIKYQYIQHIVEGHVSVVNVGTKEIVVDMFTKTIQV